MKNLGIAAVVVALVSLAIGILARLGIRIVPIGLVPMAYLHFANTALLLSISLFLAEIAGRK